MLSRVGVVERLLAHGLMDSTADVRYDLSVFLSGESGGILRESTVMDARDDAFARRKVVQRASFSPFVPRRCANVETGTSCLMAFVT